MPAAVMQTPFGSRGASGVLYARASYKVNSTATQPGLQLFYFCCHNPSIITEPLSNKEKNPFSMTSPFLSPASADSGDTVAK
jgi:hypothetical protein